MSMEVDRARTVFSSAQAAHLATANGAGTPHLVPVTYAVRDDQILIAIDNKPKTTHNVKRIRNIRQNPQVSVMVDHYEDDWTHLWWVRADGHAAVVEDGPEREAAIGALTDKYRQYREHTPEGPVISITVSRWSGWSYSG
jgi:PPOX class probable F420-dependent enzyme